MFGKGIRQRLNVIRSNGNGKPDPSPVGAVYKRLFKAGKLSAADVGDASVAVGDAAPTDLKKLGKATKQTSSGSKHSSRSLLRTLASQSSLPPLYMATTTYWNHQKQEKQSGNLALFTTA